MQYTAITWGISSALHAILRPIGEYSNVVPSKTRGIQGYTQERRGRVSGENMTRRGNFTRIFLVLSAGTLCASSGATPASPGLSHQRREAERSGSTPRQGPGCSNDIDIFSSFGSASRDSFAQEILSTALGRVTALRIIPS